MSVIALTGIPKNLKINQVLKPLKSSIKGHFEAMNVMNNKNKNDRTAFLRLSEKLDPVEVVEIINSRNKGPLRAYIPKEIPDFPVSYQNVEKISPFKLLTISIGAILQEMQFKYGGLYDLSNSTAHKLIQDIAKTLYKRLRIILEQDGAEIDGCLRLTKTYRKRHPHFADFQLILSTLHSIQDAEEKPRGQIHECDLQAFAVRSHVIDNIPFEKVQVAYVKYLDKITATVMEHVTNLDMTPKNTSPEEIARIKIREQLKTLIPYLPACVKHATEHHFVPQESDVYIVHLYGEPALPSKESLLPFFKRHKVMSTTRSDCMYNLIKFEVPKSKYLDVLGADGTLAGSIKLVIRPSNLPVYTMSESSIRSIQSSYHKQTLADDVGGEDQWFSGTYY